MGNMHGDYGIVLIMGNAGCFIINRMNIHTLTHAFWIVGLLEFETRRWIPS